VEGFSAEGLDDWSAWQSTLFFVRLVYVGGEVEEGFGTEEEAFACARTAEGELEGAGERVGVALREVGVEVEVAVAAF
jgi:hypothetical protein